MRIAQYEDEIVKYKKKKVREPLNVTKNCHMCVGTTQCEKVWEPPNVTKELSHLILELHNVKMNRQM